MATSARGKRIEAARKRVDARRAALGPYRDRPTASDKAAAGQRRQDDYRAAQGQNVGKRSVDPDRIKGLLKEGIGGYKFEWPTMMAYRAVADSWREAQEARIGGWNSPLDITRGTPAYTYLLDNVIQPEYRNDFREEVRKNNLHWTELNKYAGENAHGLAPRINLLNDPTRFENYKPIQQANYLGSIVDPNWKTTTLGIEDTGAGRKLLNEYIEGGKAMEGEGMLGNAAAEMAKEEIPPVINQTTGVASEVIPDYGDLKLTGEFPGTSAGQEQLGLADDLTDFELYKMRSQAQDRGGFTGPKKDRQSVYDELYDKIARRPSGEYMQPLYEKYFPEGGDTSAGGLTNLVMADLPERYFTDYDKILSQVGLNPNLIESPWIGFKSP